MINVEKLTAILAKYKAHFPVIWKDERYKWEAVKHFQDNWNIHAENFGEMFEQATAKTVNLLASGYNYPRAMIINFAKADDEGVRDMFLNLADEAQDVSLRIEAFQNAAESMRSKYDDGTWHQHYQNTNSISVYLWLMFPDKYYIYKYGLYKEASIHLTADYIPRRDGSVDTMIGGFKMCDEICQEIAKDDDLLKLVQSYLTPNCYLDPAHKILTGDFVHYIGSYYRYEMKKGQNGKGWLPDNYESPISTEDWIELLGDNSIFTNGSLQIMKRIKDYGGQATCSQLAVKYGESANFYNAGASSLAKRVAEAKGLPMVKFARVKNGGGQSYSLGKRQIKMTMGFFCGNSVTNYAGQSNKSI